MKIFYVARTYVPSYTANSIAVMKMCEAFANNDCEVYLLIVENDLNYQLNYDPFEFYGVSKKFKIIELPPRIKKKNKMDDYIKLIHSNIKINKPDLIYTRDNTHRYILHELGISLIVELHTEISKELDKFKSVLNSENLKKIVVINEYLKNYYIENYCINSKNIMVAQSASDINNIKDKIQLPGKNSFNVGYIGHLYPGKGMEIISKLIESCSWADFHIIGGTMEDINLWKIKLAGFENTYIHGFIQNSEIKKYTKSMDVLLAPYQQNIDCSGGGKLVSDWISPLKIFDYMSAGKAIIASNLPAIREILKNDDTALLCDYDKLDQWTQSLKRLFEDKYLRDRLGENSRAEFLNRYTWDIRAKKILYSLGNNNYKH